MTTDPNDIRRTILRKLHEQLEADVALANNLLNVESLKCVTVILESLYEDEGFDQKERQLAALVVSKVDGGCGGVGLICDDDVSKEGEVDVCKKIDGGDVDVNKGGEVGDYVMR
nr:hypothetical protein [Tanacetum cinerariifolium]